MLIGLFLITDIDKNRYFFTIFLNRVDQMMIRQPFDITVVANLLPFSNEGVAVISDKQSILQEKQFLLGILKGMSSPIG